MTRRTATTTGSAMSRTQLLREIARVRETIRDLPPGSEAYAEAHAALNDLLDRLVEVSRP